MPVAKYKFDTIFTYDSINGIIIPKYTVVINNTKLPEGVAINGNTYTGGLILFNYIGRSLAGTWYSDRRELVVEGFY